MKKNLLITFLPAIIIGCGSPTPNASNNEAPPSKEHKVFKVERNRDSNVSQLWITVKDTSKIKSLNEYLVSKYRVADFAGAFQIYYFDGEANAKRYQEMLDDRSHSFSNKQVDELSSHVIGKYYYLNVNGEVRDEQFNAGPNSDTK